MNNFNLKIIISFLGPILLMIYLRSVIIIPNELLFINCNAIPVTKYGYKVFSEALAVLYILANLGAYFFVMFILNILEFLFKQN